MAFSTHSSSPSVIKNSYLLFVFLLLLGNLLYGYNYVNSYITAKQSMLSSVASQLQKRVETYRTMTYQLYDNEISQTGPQSTHGIHETRLRPDIYVLEKKYQKINTFILGQHDASTSHIAENVSHYLDIRWGAKNSIYTLYYLNGLDNSLTLISTMPIRELSAHYKDSYLSNIVESRKAETLQQANALDERESFSNLRKYRFINAYYFTLRTTFNSPGHLATVIAFDIPVNDILPPDLPPYFFKIVEDSNTVNDFANHNDQIVAYTYLKWPWLTINANIENTAMKMQFYVPIMSLILDLSRNNSWVILINLLLFVFSYIAFYFVRHQYIRPGKKIAALLNAQQEINQEIISHLPLGLLIYRFDSNSVVASNTIADHLLPHLSLSKIADMADSHQGKIQVMVNNENYEIQMLRSQHSIKTTIFLMHNQEKDILVSQKLKLAQLEYDKNHIARKTMTDNLARELKAPLEQLQELIGQIELQSSTNQQQIQHNLQHIQHLIGEITLLSAIESDSWQPYITTFNLNQHIENLLKKIMPDLNRKGLILINRCDIAPEQMFTGDIELLQQVLQILLHYAIITTKYGKIMLSIQQDSVDPKRLNIELTDTGAGVSNNERQNIHYPNLATAQNDRFSKGSGMAYFLCAKLCEKLGGELTINSVLDVGTRYQLSCVMTPVENSLKDKEKLLDGVTAYLNIISDEIRKLVIKRLCNFGATTIIADDRKHNTQYDITLTDMPEHAQDYTLLLVTNIDGFEEYAPHRIRVNFNLNGPFIDAILLLIEQQLAVSEAASPAENTDKTIPINNEIAFKSKDYFSLFVETVPVDINKLYNESIEEDFESIALTAHRLKGVFAMLNVNTGTSLCEQLEAATKERNKSKIELLIGQIDIFVSRLLQLGSQYYE